MQTFHEFKVRIAFRFQPRVPMRLGGAFLGSLSLGFGEQRIPLGIFLRFASRSMVETRGALDQVPL